MIMEPHTKNRTFLILGGYGNTGFLLARLLLQETDLKLILAGRSREKAVQAAAHLNSLFKGNRVSGLKVDASDSGDLKQAFKKVDFVLVASSTAKYVKEVATEAIAAGIDYLDIQYSEKKVPVLQAMAPKIKDSGRCFITEAGFHPGLPAAMVRYSGQYFDRLERAVVSTVINADWGLSVSDATIYEFTEEFKDYQPFVFKRGQWQKPKVGGMFDSLKVDFGAEFGRRSCVPMTLEEMRSIPEIFPQIKETGFYIAGFNWFVDWLIFPIVMVALKLWPNKAVKPVGKLMFWGMKTFSSPPYGVVTKVEASGEKVGKAKEIEVSLYHQDGYLFTAIPVIACLLQYLDGSIKKPGLWMMGHLVEPNRLMKDMERLGIRVQVKDKTSQST